MTERSLPIAVVVGPAGLAVAKLLAQMRYQPLLVLSRRPSKRQLRRLVGNSIIIARPGELPLADESVDLVVVAGGLSAASPAYAGLAQLSRVLKRGAPLVVLAPEPEPLHAKLWLASAKLFTRKKSRPLSQTQLTGAMLQAGLSHIVQDTLNRLLPVTITIGRATRASKWIADYFAPSSFVPHSTHEEAINAPWTAPPDELPASVSNRDT